MQSVSDGALIAVASARTLLVVVKVVLVVRDQRDQAQAVRYELVVKYGGVLFHLHDVDCHSGNFGDYDPAEGVRHVQFCIGQLKLEVVPV